MPAQLMAVASSAAVGGAASSPKEAMTNVPKSVTSFQRSESSANRNYRPFQADGCDKPTRPANPSRATGGHQPPTGLDPLEAGRPSYRADIGIGYTLATGRLFCPISDFHEYAETLLGRPIHTVEFADKKLWAEMRETFENCVKAAVA
jgi:hypothetical protein